MENIVGYTVHFLKRVGEPEMNRQQLEITSKIIPLELKDSFVEFINSIGGEVPMEDEFNQWYSKQK